MSARSQGSAPAGWVLGGGGNRGPQPRPGLGPPPGDKPSPAATERGRMLPPLGQSRSPAWESIWVKKHVDFPPSVVQQASAGGMLRGWAAGPVKQKSIKKAA